MKRHKIEQSYIVGDFNENVGKKMTPVGSFGIGTRNNGGDMLLRFAERNNLKVTNTFFECKAPANRLNISKRI